MNFENPNAWLLAALSLLIAFLYLWTFRRRTHEVATLVLWQRALARRPAWFVLRFWLSLGFQILILLLLVAALAEPLFTAAAARRRNLVLVIDVSASMAAKDVEPQRLAQAQAAARRIIGGMQAGEQAAIVSAGSLVRTVRPFTNRRDSLLAGLDTLQTSDGVTRIEDAVSLARRMLAARANPRIIVLSDGGFDHARSLTAVEDVTLLLFGEAGSNLGITGFAVRPSVLQPAQSEAFLRIEGHLAAATKCLLRLSFQDRAASPSEQSPSNVPPIELSLAAGEVSEARLISLPTMTGDGLWTARLEPADDLAADDVAYAPIRHSRRMTVALIGTAGSPLEAALRNLKEIDLTIAVAAEEVAAAEVWVYDRVVPEPAKMSRGPSLVIDPAASSELWKLGEPLRDSAAAIASARSDSPLLTGTRIEDALVEEAAKLTIVAPHETLATAVSGDPLYALIERQSQPPVLLLGVNLSKSDLALRPDFPLLIGNAVRWLRPQSQPQPEAFRTSDVLAIESTAATNELQSPDGNRRPLFKPVALAALDQAGLWHATGDTLPSHLLDPRETRLTRDPTLQVAEIDPVVAPHDPHPAPLLLGLALILMLVNAVLIHGRIVV